VSPKQTAARSASPPFEIRCDRERAIHAGGSPASANAIPAEGPGARNRGDAGIQVAWGHIVALRATQEAQMTARSMPDGLGGERSLLDGWLDYYRAALLAKCEGLTGQQLITRSCEPSPMSLIGLARHMTEMERVYGHRLADWGTSLLYCTDEAEEGDFEAVTASGAAADLETFRAHCARTRQIMAAHHLDETFGPKGSHTLRWFYLYLIKEYARHLGHADLLRERIDGATGE
jgi:uncharacterized protein DUF664